jgi:hypothetical protein
MNINTHPPLYLRREWRRAWSIDTNHQYLNRASSSAHRGPRNPKSENRVAPCWSRAAEDCVCLPARRARSTRARLPRPRRSPKQAKINELPGTSLGCATVNGVLALHGYAHVVAVLALAPVRGILRSGKKSRVHVGWGAAGSGSSRERSAPCCAQNTTRPSPRADHPRRQLCRLRLAKPTAPCGMTPPPDRKKQLVRLASSASLRRPSPLPMARSCRWPPTG